MTRKRYLITASAFDRKGRAISTAENNYTKTHPLMQHFAEKVNLHEKLYLHAEILSLIRAGEQKVHTLVVERFNSGKPALAKPCPVCAEAIRAYGVKIVRYSVDGGYAEETIQ